MLRVIDGDTLKINYHDREESLRLIGIDTPEINTKEGKEASAFVKALINPCDVITVEFDIQKRDRFGRFLGYVYFNEKMLNEEIIRAGHAKPMTVPPNTKYAENFKRIY